MTKTLASLAIGVLFVYLTGFKPTENYHLKVEVTGIENKPSTKVWVSVFSKNDFLKTSLQTKYVSVSGSKITVEFALPQGEYAVSTYHDLNDNKELDRYFFGKPKEPYGFSNNIKPSLGPPDFDDCKFILNNSAKTVSVILLD